MCSFLFATIRLVIAGAVFTGGLAGLAVKVCRAGDVMPNSDERKNQKNLRDYESVGIRFCKQLRWWGRRRACRQATEIFCQ
jgi:hypothetical protein